jgi:hypothetical protein
MRTSGKAAEAGTDMYIANEASLQFRRQVEVSIQVVLWDLIPHVHLHMYLRISNHLGQACLPTVTI